MPWSLQLITHASGSKDDSLSVLQIILKSVIYLLQVLIYVTVMKLSSDSSEIPFLMHLSNV